MVINIDAKADVKTKNKNGNTAKSIAADNGQNEIVKLLNNVGAK